MYTYIHIYTYLYIYIYKYIYLYVYTHTVMPLLTFSLCLIKNISNTKTAPFEVEGNWELDGFHSKEDGNAYQPNATKEELYSY